MLKSQRLINVRGEELGRTGIPKQVIHQYSKEEGLAYEDYILGQMRKMEEERKKKVEAESRLRAEYANRIIRKSSRQADKENARKKVILDAIKGNGGTMTRIDVIKATGMPLTTVATYLKRLADEGILVREEAGSGKLLNWRLAKRF